MPDIEWQSTEELQPAECSVKTFCQEHYLAWGAIPEDPQPLTFIEQEALASLHESLKDPYREHGGVLVGFPYHDKEAGRYFNVINKAVPAFNSQGSAVHLQFTPETWDYISGILEQEETPGLSVVGWYHSHPNLGVFMSGTDRATQRAFYNHSWSVAVVVDPVKQNTGWFSGPDCDVMDVHHVIAFRDVLKETGREKVHEPLPIGPDLHTYRWLLPIGMFLIFFLTWMVIRRFRI